MLVPGEIKFILNNTYKLIYFLEYLAPDFFYCIREEDILAWRTYNDLEFIQCACRFTENCSVCDNGGGGSKRQEIKTLIRRLKRDNPQIETSIFNSIHSVNIETFPGYKKNGTVHSYLEDYDDRNLRTGI